MISLDAHESQGFALEEAMSCNIPLLVSDAQTMYEEYNDGVNSTYYNHRPKKMLSTSVPYWSEQCGIKIDNINKINDAVDKFVESVVSKISIPVKKDCWSYDILFIITIQNKNYNSNFKRNFLIFFLLYISNYIKKYLNNKRLISIDNIVNKNICSYKIINICFKINNIEW